MAENETENNEVFDALGCVLFAIIVAFVVCWVCGLLLYFGLFWLILLAIYLLYKLNKYLQDQEMRAAAQEKWLAEQRELPIQRYTQTKKDELAQLEVASDVFVRFAVSELDTFFLDEWTKMREIYQDKTGQFDDAQKEIAWEQMCDILGVIFVKFEEKRTRELIKKRAMDAELRAKYTDEIAVAKSVYQKWSTEDLEDKS